jgi:hypothetical protein
MDDFFFNMSAPFQILMAPSSPPVAIRPSKQAKERMLLPTWPLRVSKDLLHVNVLVQPS